MYLLYYVFILILNDFLSIKDILNILHLVFVVVSAGPIDDIFNPGEIFCHTSVHSRKIWESIFINLTKIFAISRNLLNPKCPNNVGFSSFQLTYGQTASNLHFRCLDDGSPGSAHSAPQETMPHSSQLLVSWLKQFRGPLEHVILTNASTIVFIVCE